MSETTPYNNAFDEAAKEKKDAAGETKETAPVATGENKNAGDKKAPEPKPAKEETKKDDFKALYEAEKAKREAAESALKQHNDAQKSQPEGKAEETATADGGMRSLIRAELQTLFGPVLLAQAMRQHVDSISKEHPDWSEIANSDDLKTWIDSHPDYMAQSLRQVAEKGTAQQVVDMLKRFKEHKDGGRNADARGETLPDDDLTRRVLDATAVRGRSAGPPASSPAAQDFASAFAEAAKSLS